MKRGAVLMLILVSLVATASAQAGHHRSSDTAQTTRSPQEARRPLAEFPMGASKVPLGRRVTYKVPHGIDPHGKFRPPAAIVTMRLPRGVRYDPLRVVRVGKPIRPEYYGSGWFQGHGWRSLNGWGLADPTAMLTDMWSFGWARVEQRCDGTAVDLANRVRACEAFYTVRAPGGGGESTTRQDHVQVLQLWKHARHGGYLFLYLKRPWRGEIPTGGPDIARAFDRKVFNEGLAFMGSVDTRPHKGPLAWPSGPTHRPTKCEGLGPGGAPVTLPPSDCGPVAGPAGNG